MKIRQTYIGPPGTGKTTHIMKMIENLVREENLDTSKLGLVTFTKVAAGVLAKRSGISSKYIGTIHSLAFRQAKLTRSQVADYLFYKKFSEKIGVPISNRNIEDNENIELGDELLAIYQYARATCSENIENVYLNTHRPGSLGVFTFFVESLNEHKKQLGVIDYNDMLEIAMRYSAPDIDALFVDEAQDLSPLQWKLLDYWDKHIERIYVIGDDDQAIFSWGGADPEGIAKWRKKHDAKQTVLDQSYRIPRQIHSIANKLIRKIDNRIDKIYKPQDREGELRIINEINLLDFSHNENCTVLYRNHSIRRKVENRLIDLNLPYRALNGYKSIYDSYFANAVRTWLDAKEEYENFGNFSLSTFELKKLEGFLFKRAFECLIDTDITKNPFDKYRNWTEAFIPDKIRDYNYLRNIYIEFGNLHVNPTIKLSTIHGYKGEENDRIILIDGMGQRTMNSFLRDPEPEYRVFYVGMTRARKQLDIVFTENNILSDILYDK